ncbi:MAG TPA: 6-phosphogluconolactonase [Candidatus Acidoferrales bacterium]|nr:6-phosphogluconolactonase [Candidatus Acidoferrales bacterium]
MSEIVVCKDLGDLSLRVAAEFVSLARASVESAGRFTVCLSGGSTPAALYRLLASAAFAAKVPWDKCHFFWGDERCVPPDHPESNYALARAALLSKVAVPQSQVYRMPGEKPPDLAALRYEATLRTFFNLRAGSYPRFDLILLGLGADGHTASLFPGSEALAVRDRCVVAPYVESLKAHRLTLTLAVINRAANVFFLVSGAEKAEILARVLEPSDENSLPAARVKPEQGRLVWFVDEAAAAKIER